MRSKPILLLDIDGVINVIAHNPPKFMWTGDWHRAQTRMAGEDWPLLWNQDVVDGLSALHLEGLAEIRWHTTWQAEAPRLGEIVGLPVFEVHRAPEFAGPLSWGRLTANLYRQNKPPWWKYPAVERVLTDEKRRLIWVDDDISKLVNRSHREQMSHLGSSLLLSPNTDVGLGPWHLQQIRKFCESDA